MAEKTSKLKYLGVVEFNFDSKKGPTSMDQESWK